MSRDDCPSADVLSRYAVGELSEAEADALSAHLGACAGCLARLDDLAARTYPLIAALRRPHTRGPHQNCHLDRAVASSRAASPRGGLIRLAELGPAPGEVLNGYRLLGEVGQGGMGRVYRAVHPRLGQEVAVKVLRPGMDSAPILARFEAERRALPLMDHPHIARVIDGGSTPDGRPFFVMELVKGVSITRYCDERRLDVRGRLGLFLDVCGAIQHAHQKGIIHRDLKPSNVLVTEYDGRPAAKVIDFGIAKATEPRAGAITEVGRLVGTPEYMSPEQAGAASSDIDTRSDIYALGVVLYELLAGDTPFAGKAPLLEVLRAVREDDPPPPSARLGAAETVAETARLRATEAGRLARQVRGELDWIVMRCLEKDRDRRYETAAALAEDVRRFLNDEPVQAGPPSRWYRLRKFTRRHRGAVAVGVTSALLLLGAAALSAWLAVRATNAEHEALLSEQQAKEQRDAALEAKEQADEASAVARAVNDFLQNDLLRLADGQEQAKRGQPVKPDLTLREVLDRAAARIGGRFAGQPLVEAGIRQAIGDAYRGIGEAKAGVPHLERAVALRKAKLGADHPETLAAMESLLFSYYDAGQSREALELLNETVRRKLNNPEVHKVDLRLSMDVVNQIYHGGNIAEAIRLHEETIPLQKRAWGPDHPDTLESMHGLALAYQFANRYLDRMKLLEEVHDLTVKKYGEDDLRTLKVMDDLALAYGEVLRPRDVVRLRERALPLLRAKLGHDHPDTLKCMTDLARGYRETGRAREAVPIQEEAVRLLEQKRGRDHRNTLRALRNLGLVYEAAGDLTRAEGVLRDLLARERAALGLDHPDTATTLWDLAGLLLKQGRPADAEVCLRDAVGIREKRSPDDWLTGNIRALLGEALTARQKYADAEPVLLRACRELQPPAGQEPEPARQRCFAETLQRLVRLYEGWGKPEEAARWRAKLPPAKAPEKTPPEESSAR